MSGHDSGAWYNDFFLRGQPKKMQKMVRIKIKGKLKSDNPYADYKEPDFYSMPPLAFVTKSKAELKPSGCTEVSLSSLLAHSSAFTEVSLRPNECTNEFQYDAKKSNHIPEELPLPVRPNVNAFLPRIASSGLTQPALWNGFDCVYNQHGVPIAQTNECDFLPTLSRMDCQQVYRQATALLKILSSCGEAKSDPPDDMEPLPFEDDVNDFALCIDEVIQAL